MIVIGHQTICDYRYATRFYVTLNQPQEVFIVTRIEKDDSLSRAAVVDVVILVRGKDISSVRHILFQWNLPQV